MHRRTPIVAAVAALVALACQQDQVRSTGMRSEARDSAEIRIVENAEPPEGSRLPWRIGPEPTMSIGVLEGEEPYMLLHAFHAARLSDGRIVVANSGTSEVRMFDASGTHLLTWGRPGEGPGEFMGLIHAGPWPGDSIVTWFTSGRRISIFDSDGNYGRTFGLRRGRNAMWMPPSPIAVRADGTILSVNYSSFARGSDTVAVDVWDGDGRLFGSLGRHLNRKVRFTTDERGRRQLKSYHFGWEFIAGLWGDHIVAGPNRRYEIRAFRADGTLVLIVRREHVPRVPTEADVEPSIQAGFANEPEIPEGIREELLKDLRSRLLAETFPAFTTILADAADNLWVREYDFPREVRPAPLWTVFDPEGRVLGFVETPKDLLHIHEIGENYILGVALDELGVESIQLWPLERSEG